jgi:lipopolysaccharide/colanic/teichoic acid biosynthesis glycosyltransferase
MLHVVHAEGQNWISLSGGSGPLYYSCKRCMDVVLALLLLGLLSPLLLLIAVLIKLDSPGPIVFVQERVSARRRSRSEHTIWELRNFRFYKFRSMVQDADQSMHQAHIQAFVEGRVEPPDGAGATFKMSNDSRVTRVGRILRKASLDELPQLLNVLKGEMSLVGPRPVPTYEVAQYKPRHYYRLAALPGLTGIWQVKGRCRVPFDDMIRMDVEYLSHQSLWLDIKILLLTIPAVVSGRGAE